MAVRVFLSYSRNDGEPFVARLNTALTAAGFEVWFDRVSMPSRQLTFHQEIRDAVAGCDRLILVIGPNAITSDYVIQEWRFAYFEAVKCVNPIVRVDGIDAAGKKIDAYSLIPEDLKLIHAEDFRNDAEFDLHLDNLARQLSEPLPPAGKLVAVPGLPTHYLEQRDRINALRDIVLADLRQPVVVSGATGRVGLQGMGGIGKSVLAAALVHDPEVQRAFPDGLYWLTLGQELSAANLVERQRWLAHILSAPEDFTSIDVGRERLREALRDRAALLVLDDVWRREDAEAFNVQGPRFRLLLTTRDAGLVTALAAKENHYQVQLPTDVEARSMLASAAGIVAEALPAEADDVIAQCGRLPLALTLCGGMVHGGTAWRDILEVFRARKLTYISDEHELDPNHRDIWTAMDVSLRVLPTEEAQRFAELAVFAMDARTPEEAVLTLWEHTAGMEALDARALINKFVRRSLVQRPIESNIQLHDLLHNFATGKAPKLFNSLAALHQSLVEAYRKKCPSDWPSGPNDGYFQENLVHHLIEANRVEEAVTLLTDIPWIEAKSKTGLVFSLQKDYSQVIAALPEAQPDLGQERDRQAALARWTQTLIDCALKRRLPKPEEIIPSVEPWSDERIEAECKGIIESPTRFDQLKAFTRFVEKEAYPLLEFGERPGFVIQHGFNSAPDGPVHRAAAGRPNSSSGVMLQQRWPVDAIYNPKPALLRTLEGHSWLVLGVAVTVDGRRAVSASSSDSTLKVWDLETGRELRTLRGCSPVAATPDGRLAISASGGNTLKVWDLESGRELCRLKGHSGPLVAVAVTPDGRCAVSASLGETLKVWDLETGRELRTLRGCSPVAMTPDGRTAISASLYKNLKVWDLETGRELRTLEGHSSRVEGLAVTPDGRRAISASSDRTLKVWDLETGRKLRTLEGHSSPVKGVAVTADGHRAVSASEDKTLKVWDLETGRELRTLRGHSDWVLVAPGEGAIMAAPEGAMAPLVDGSERARRCRISLGMESQESRDAGPEGPTNRARQAREKEARAAEGWSAINF